MRVQASRIFKNCWGDRPLTTASDRPHLDVSHTAYVEDFNIMTESRRVGFPDGQFLANGVDEQSSLKLADCWFQGNHEKAVEVIASLPENIQPAAERIYERCKQILPREGLYEWTHFLLN